MNFVLLCLVDQYFSVKRGEHIKLQLPLKYFSGVTTLCARIGNVSLLLLPILSTCEAIGFTILYSRRQCEFLLGPMFCVRICNVSFLVTLCLYFQHAKQFRELVFAFGNVRFFFFFYSCPCFQHAKRPTMAFILVGKKATKAA